MSEQTITQMKRELLASGISNEALKHLSEKQIEARYNEVCKNLTKSISGNSNEDSNTLYLEGQSTSDYKKALEKHNKEIDELIAGGDYVKAIWKMLNPPKNPNLIMGTPPDLIIGGAGVVNIGKSILKILKDPKKIIEIADAAKKYAVKSIKDLVNLVKSFLVQSKASMKLPEYVNMTKKSGYGVKTVVEALRFGNVTKNVPLKIAETFSKKYAMPIEKIAKNIKVVQAEVNGEVKTFYSCFNPKDGKALLLNESGGFEAYIDFKYDSTGKLIDAVYECNGYGNGGEKISEMLFNPRKAVGPNP